VAIRTSPTPSEDDALERYGVENLSSSAGGALLEIVGEFEPAFDRVTREIAGNYLLGVEVEASDRDGNPHRVDVKVRRPGVTVRARRQYVIGKPLAASPASAEAAAGGDEGGAAVDRAELQTGVSQLSHNRILTAARDLEGTGDVYLRVRSAEVASRPDGTREVAVDLTIDPRSVYFTSIDNRRVARLGISIFCGDSKRAVVGESWQEMNLALKDDSYQRFKADGIPYKTRVPVRGDAHHVKVIVYDFRSDLVGAMTARVRQ
jgi:hypothetical protein